MTLILKIALGVITKTDNTVNVNSEIDLHCQKKKKKIFFGHYKSLQVSTNFN